MSISISTNISSHLAQQSVARAGTSIDSSLHKLATGFRINRAADDPSGLIASTNLQAALAALEFESASIQRIDAVASVAEGALSEVSGLLNDASAAALAAENTGALSEAERDAYQLQVNSARQSIDRIVSTTEFNGQNLLSGAAALTSGDSSVPISRVATPAATLDSIAAAIAQVSTLRAQIGAFQKETLGAQSALNESAAENTAAANSSIRDTDFAAESAAFARARVLHSSSIAALAIANITPRNALSILA